MKTTPFAIMQRYVGLKEIPGDDHHPWIQWCFSLCDGFDGNTADEVPWCAAALQHPFWELRLPRSKSARARSWLSVGRAIELEDAVPGHDVVILKRGANPRAGHVGLFAGIEWSGRDAALKPKGVYLLGANQGDAVSLKMFPVTRVIGVRRIT